MYIWRYYQNIRAYSEDREFNISLWNNALAHVTKERPNGVSLIKRITAERVSYDKKLGAVNCNIPQKSAEPAVSTERSMIIFDYPIFGKATTAIPMT